MSIEYRQADAEQPLGYKAVYVSPDNPLPVALVGGGGGGPVTGDDVTVDEEGGTLTDYITANDAAVSAAALTATWGQVANRPSTYPPATHTHTVANVTGLQDILDGYETRIAALEAAVNAEPEA